jgi:hypothetical protein
MRRTVCAPLNARWGEPALYRNDPDHARCAELLVARSDEVLVTPHVVAEAGYLVGKYVGADAEINLVEGLAGRTGCRNDETAGPLIRRVTTCPQTLTTWSLRA